MKLLITGASGFVASQIIPDLSAAGAELVLVSRNVDALQVRYPGYTIGCYEDWARLANGVDVVVHLAAKNNDKDDDAEAFFAANTALVSDVLDKTKAAGVAQLIFTSSLHARSAASGKSHYASSKKAAEDLLQAETNLAVRIYQLPAVYGNKFAGKLAMIMWFPASLQPVILNVLRAVRPTLKARRLTDEILSAAANPRPECKLLTDEQRDNPVFDLFKRSIDIFFVVAIGSLFFWLIAIVWLGVKLTSKGPGIFAQERVGRHGRPFICYKFRTMQKGTKHVGTHELSRASTTRIGAILRRTKIDEFPQIINILKGEMSLVGPRPSLTTQTELIEARRDLGVLDVRPGITGLSQIRNIDMSTPVILAEADAEYIALRSILLELKIIIATATGSGQGDKTRGV